MTLNLDKTEVVLLGKTKILEDTVLLAFDGVQLILAALVKSLGIIPDPALLLEKQINAAAKNPSNSDWLPLSMQPIWPIGSTQRLTLRLD